MMMMMYFHVSSPFLLLHDIYLRPKGERPIIYAKSPPSPTSLFLFSYLFFPCRK